MPGFGDKLVKVVKQEPFKWGVGWGGHTNRNIHAWKLSVPPTPIRN